MSATISEEEKLTANSYCRDFIRGFCSRDNCRYVHELPQRAFLKELFPFCHDYQNKGCFRLNCKFIHSTAEDENNFYLTGQFPQDPRVTPICQAFIHGNCKNNDCKFIHNQELVINNSNHQNNGLVTQFARGDYDNGPPEAKFRRIVYEKDDITNCINLKTTCASCDALEHKVKLLHDNISVLLNKVADLTEKNSQLTSMNEFLLQQTATVRSDQPCVITSRHCTSAPVSLATVTMTPVVSLAGGLTTLVPAAATPNLALAPAASRAQILTPAPQIIAVSTTQQLVGNSGTLIVTSAGAQQLMQVSDSATLMGGGQTVVAVTPAQLTLAPQTQQIISSAPPTAVHQLVQQSAQQLVQPQLTAQHPGSQYAAAQQSVQHLAAQQSAQLAAQQSAQLVAHQSAQHLVQQSAQSLAAQSAQHLAAAAAQQSAQHLAAAQQSAQHLAAAQQSAQQQLAAAQQSAQQQLAAAAAAQQSAQLVHQTSTQQITISSTSQPLALSNSQPQPIISTFPMISQSMLPH